MGFKSLTLLSLVLTFGWNGSPVEYGIFGQAWKVLHRGWCPPHPQWHDLVPYHSKLLMDDQVLVEPSLGVRPWLSRRAAEFCARQVFGPDCINQSKKGQEGKFAESQTVWGLTMDTKAFTLQLPPPKVERLHGLAADPSCDRGSRTLEVLMVQRLRGMLTFAVVTRPQLLPELGAIDRMLATTDPGGKRVAPVGSPAQVDRIWTEWWEAVEALRVYTADPAAWVSHFTLGLTAVLSPRERLALPGAAEQLLWAGGDSTLERLGCIDFDARVWGVLEAREVFGRIQELEPFAEDDIIISLGELFAFLLLAIAQVVAWRGRIVLYVTDNQVVQTWLTKRYARNALARFGLRLLGRLEAVGDFTSVAAYVWTKHNLAPDFITRAPMSEVLYDFELRGYSRLDLESPWKEMVASCAAGRPLALPGESSPTAAAARRIADIARPLPAQITMPIGLRVLEWRAHFGSYSPIWNHRRVDAWVMPHRETVEAWKILRPQRAKVFRPRQAVKNHSYDLVVTSLTPDPSGEALWRFAEAAAEVHAPLLFFDAPVICGVWDAVTIRSAGAYEVRAAEVLTTALGARTARRRLLGAGAHSADTAERVLTAVLACTRSCAEAMGPGLLPVEAVDSALWLDPQIGRVTIDPRIVTTCDRLLPRPVGRWEYDQSQHLVYDTAGPSLGARTVGTLPLGYGNSLVRDIRGPPPQVRRLDPVEVWTIAGHNPGIMAQARSLGASEDDCMRLVCRELPRQVAEAISAPLLQAAHTSSSDRAGVGVDPEEDVMDESFAAWLAAWKICPASPGEAYQSWLQARKESRAGGRRVADMALSELVIPSGTSPPGGSSPMPGRGARAEPIPSSKRWPPIIGGPQYAHWRRGLALSFVLGRLAVGTRVPHDIGWKQWSRFCHARKRDPILCSEDPATMREDEEVLLDFVVHLVAVMGRTSGTTRGKLFAIRAAHLALGLRDPLVGKTRVFFALSGIRRREGAVRRKKPVTIEMLQRARAKCSAMGRRGVVLWAAIAVGFFFLLRASEFLEVEGAPWHLRRVVKGMDLVLRRRGSASTDAADADELVLRIPGSKTDQYNVGCVRNHYLAGCEICPVRAVQDLAREFPERWDAETALPAFRNPKNVLLTRIEIQSFPWRVRFSQSPNRWCHCNVPCH